jgi:hypothetical protein
VFDAPAVSSTVEDVVVEDGVMRWSNKSNKLTKHVTGAVLALLTAMVVVGCEASDEFEYMKSERQMIRQGRYGAGLSDADRQKLQESYASNQLSKATPTSGGAAP